MFVESDEQQGISNPLGGLLNLDNKRVSYQPILFGFAICVLIVLFIDSAHEVIDFSYLAYSFSSLYLLDFFYRMYISNDRIKFLKVFWVDLLLCLPIYSINWIVVTVTARSVKIVLEFIMKKIHSAFTSMVILGVSLMVFATISILRFETVPEANIKGFGDAIWWSFVTITTVGYGDRFPVTLGGRLVSAVLMLAGIGLFGTLVGYFSSIFMDKEKRNNDSVDTIEELAHKLDELKEEIRKQNEKV